MAAKALQQQVPHSHCFGCGQSNPRGLGLRSYWAEDGSCVAEFEPRPWHSAASRRYVNEGVIATLLDCHCVSMATAAAYLAEGRAVGVAPHLNYTTRSLNLSFSESVPMGPSLGLDARIVSFDIERIAMAARVRSADRVYAEAEIVAIPMPDGAPAETGREWAP